MISPKNEERVSLVYFGYPPRGLSLNEIQNNMLNGWNLSLRGRRQPLDDYYLLRNQSVVVIDSNNNNNNNNAEDDATNNDDDDDDDDDDIRSPPHPNLQLLAAAEGTYQNIWNIPIKDIVQFKWKQVNRDDG